MRESSKRRSETARLKYRIPLERFFLPLRQVNTKTLEGIPMRMARMYADVRGWNDPSANNSSGAIDDIGTDIYHRRLEG